MIRCERDMATQSLFLRRPGLFFDKLQASSKYAQVTYTSRIITAECPTVVILLVPLSEAQVASKKRQEPTRHDN